MPDYWSVPVATGAITDLNDTIAKGPDLSWLANLPNAYWQGKDANYVQRNRDVFQNGVPALGTALLDVAKAKGADALPDVITAAKLEYAREANKNVFPDEGGSSPTIGISPPSSGTAIPNTGLRPAPTNNSGNIENGSFAASQPGYVPTNGRFASFATPEAGDNAASALLQSYGAKGVSTPNAIAAKWAPAGDGSNNPQAYGAFIAKQLGVAPDQPIDLSNPAIRKTVVGAIRQFEGNGSSSQPVQTAVAPVQTAQAQPQQVSQPVQTTPQGTSNGIDPTLGRLIPSSIAQRYGADAPGVYINMLSRYIDSGMLPADQVKNYQSRIDAIQSALSKNAELTQSAKDYQTYLRQGGTGTQQQFEVRQKFQQTQAGKQGEQYAAKYDNLQESGMKATATVPQLQIAKRITTGPNWYSGFAANKVLVAKQIIGALGGDPNSAAPMQEAQGLVNQAILGGLKSIVQGTGQVRSAELHLMQSAAAAPYDSPDAYRFKLEVALRAQQRAIDLADLAQQYHGGTLDSGFDRVATDYVKSHPLFSATELKNPRLLGLPQFSSPDEVTAAKLPHGAQFRVGDTDQIRVVP